MAESDFQCTLLGDVLFRTSTTVGISLTVSGPTTYAWTSTLDAGTWFSSPLALILFMVDSWNDSIPGGQMSVSLVSDPDNANYRKLAFVPETGLGTITNFRIQIPGVYTDFGLTSSNHDLGSGTSTKYSAALPYVMTPYWPPASYSRAVESLTGSSDMGHDGTAYSQSGITQGKVTISWALNRFSDWNETALFRDIWRDRSPRGRAVKVYMDRTQLPITWSDQIVVAAGEVLELAANGERLDFSRMMDLRETINYTRELEFVCRKMRPTDTFELYNEAPAAAAPANRVTHWYRANFSEALSASGYTMPDDEDVCAAIWFRVITVDSSGIILNESGWPDAIVAEEEVDPSYYRVTGNGSDYSPVWPRYGQWTLLTLYSNGGEISYRLNGVAGEDVLYYDVTNANPILGTSATTSIILDVANIGYFNGVGVLTAAGVKSLHRAGPSHDYAIPVGDWPGAEPEVYWCGAPSGSNIPNSGNGTSHNLTFSGTPIYGTF